MIKTIRQQNPDCEIILLGTMLANPMAKNQSKNQTEYTEYLGKLAKNYENVSVVDIGAMHQDLLDAGLAAELVADPIHSALRKFFRVSTMSAVMAYYDCAIGAVRENPERMEMLMQLADELLQIAEKRNAPYEDDVIGDVVNSVHSYAPDFKTSLKNDIDRGSRNVEYQTMFFDVYDLGRELGLEMPAYGKVSRKFGYKDKMS